MDHAEHDFGRFGLRFDAGLFGLDLRVAGGRVDERCLLYTSPSPRDGLLSRMPSSA